MAKGIRTVATTVRRIDTLSDGIKRIVLSDEDEWELPPFFPGAHIDLHLDKGLVRTYSLCNDPADRHRYVIAVKREAEGRGGSRLIHERLGIGSRIGVSLPRGGMRMSSESKNLFVAGGIGITPFLSVIRSMEANDQKNYELHWICRGMPSLLGEIPFAADRSRVHLYDTVTGARPNVAAIIASAGPDVRALCCGPTSMLNAFEAATEQWTPERKHVERFTGFSTPGGSNAAPYELVLAQSQKRITVTPELGLLGALDALDADVPVSCAGGICGACRTRWIEGPPIHHDRVLTPAERATQVIVCVAECAGPRLVLDV